MIFFDNSFCFKKEDSLIFTFIYSDKLVKCFFLIFLCFSNLLCFFNLLLFFFFLFFVWFFFFFLYNLFFLNRFFGGFWSWHNKVIYRWDNSDTNKYQLILIKYGHFLFGTLFDNLSFKLKISIIAIPCSRIMIFGNNNNLFSLWQVILNDKPIYLGPKVVLNIFFIQIIL